MTRETKTTRVSLDWRERTGNVQAHLDRGEAQRLDDEGDVGTESGSGSNESDGEEDVRKDTRVGNGLENLLGGDILGVVGLLRVVVDDAGGENVALALGEVVKAGEEEGGRRLRGLREDDCEGEDCQYVREGREEEEEGGTYGRRK